MTIYNISCLPRLITVLCVSFDDCLICFFGDCLFCFVWWLSYLLRLMTIYNISCLPRLITVLSVSFDNCLFCFVWWLFYLLLLMAVLSASFDVCHICFAWCLSYLIRSMTVLSASFNDCLIGLFDGCQYGWDVASSGANYISHKISYLEHCSFQNITPANYNTLWSVYLGLNSFTNNLWASL